MEMSMWSTLPSVFNSSIMDPFGKQCKDKACEKDAEDKIRITQ